MGYLGDSLPVALCRSTMDIAKQMLEAPSIMRSSYTHRAHVKHDHELFLLLYSQAFSAPKHCPAYHESFRCDTITTVATLRNVMS